MYYVYIIRCKNNSLYTGVTNDIFKRYLAHLLAKGAKYTKINKVRNIEIIFVCKNKSEALKLEYFIKQQTRKNKKKIIENTYKFLFIFLKERNIEIIKMNCSNLYDQKNVCL